MVETQPSAQPSRDDDTVERLKSKDPQGLQQLLEDYGGRAQWILRREFRHALGEHEIDEALNAAAHDAWRSAATYDPSRGTLRAWFYRVARNAALKVLQRERRARTVMRLAEGDLGDVFAPAGSPEEISAPQRRFLDRVRAAVDALPRMQREIMRADLACGGSADATELARVLQTSRNSIYASRSIARKTVRKALGDDVSVSSAQQETR